MCCICVQSDPRGVGGGVLSKGLESRIEHGTEAMVNAGPLSSWLVMDGCADSSLEASAASVRQKETNYAEGDATIWKPFGLGFCYDLETVLNAPYTVTFRVKE